MLGSHADSGEHNVEHNAVHVSVVMQLLQMQKVSCMGPKAVQGEQQFLCVWLVHMVTTTALIYNWCHKSSLDYASSSPSNDSMTFCFFLAC